MIPSMSDRPEDAAAMAEAVGHGGPELLHDVADKIDAGRAMELAPITAACLRLIANEHEFWEDAANGLQLVLTKDRLDHAAELAKLRVALGKASDELEACEAAGHPDEVVTFVFVSADDPEAIHIGLAADLALKVSEHRKRRHRRS